METYKEIRKEEIRFKVRGENIINEIINDLTPKLLNYFEGLQGKQILKSGASVTTGELFKKYKDSVNLIIEESENKFKTKKMSPLIYLDINCYFIILKIKIRFNNLNENGFLYYEGYKYILNIKDLILKDFYKVEEVGKIDKNEQYNIFEYCLRLLNTLNEEKKKLKPYSLRELVK